MPTEQNEQESPGAASGLTYSFDVFDTCVSRTYAHPRDLFYDLGLRLAPTNITERKRRRFAARFQSLRIRAEKRAHKRARPRQTVTIENIYRHFRSPSGLSAELKDLVCAEVDLERESMYPVPAMVAHIERLRSDGNRVIFISDMYLPACILAPMLQECGVMRQGEKLYVSCDVGVSKHDGELFYHVLKTEGLEPSQLVHCGDNLHADMQMASRANIKASHVSDGMLNVREAGMAGRRLPRQRGRSFLAGLARRLRLSMTTQIGHGANPLDHVIHGILVPFLLIYVMWVLAHAKCNNIQRLYFVARDGEILFRIAQALQGADGDIELRYLFGSRRTWLPPSITPGNNCWQRSLIIPGQTSSKRDLAARMGLDEESQEAIRSLTSCSAADWARQLPRGEAVGFLGELMCNASTREVVYLSVARQREVAVCYFKQEGLFGDTPWALVDAGWSLNSQAALKRILDIGGEPHHAPKGYYLALARDHLEETQAGIAYPFIPKAGSLFSRRRVIIEHCFLTSTHATTRGYQMKENQPVPAFGQELRGEAELAYAAKLHEAAISAARLVAADPAVSSALTEHVGEILSNVESFLRRPNAADARAMAMFSTVADMRHEKTFVESLCRPLRRKDAWTVFSKAISKKKNLESPPFMWLEGSMALSPWHVRIPLEFALLADDLRNFLKG